MQIKLVLAEKPSVAQSVARVLGAIKHEDDYLQGNGYIVSWCVGHLVELAQPKVYDSRCRTQRVWVAEGAEGLMIESLQAFMDRLIQLRQRQKLAVPQSRQNEGRDDTNGTFHRRLVLGRTDSGRQDRRAVMLRQLLIRLVENDLILAMLLHTGFQVVALDDPGNAAEVFERIHMSGGPGFLVHGEECLHIAVAAVGQGRHEHIGREVWEAMV